MTTKKEDDVYVSGEPEIVAMAEPTKQEPIPSGHQRFYCSKCQTVRLLDSDCSEPFFSQQQCSLSSCRSHTIFRTRQLRGEAPTVWSLTQSHRYVSAFPLRCRRLLTMYILYSCVFRENVNGVRSNRRSPLGTEQDENCGVINSISVKSRQSVTKQK